MYDPFAGHASAEAAVQHLRQLWEERRLAYFHYPAATQIRHGWGVKPAHPEILALIEKRRDEIDRRLTGYASLAKALAAVRRDPGAGPHWRNTLLPAIDAVSIVGMIREFGPRRFVEVGSGNSTRFARFAVERFVPQGCEIVSIDAYPGDTIAGVPDRLINKSLRDADLSLFGALREGDIVWIDGSHVTYAGSDVAVFFLEVLPSLRPGVVIGVHDIALPWDYPPGMAELLFGEAQMMAAYLLGARDKVRIMLPCFYANNIDLRLRERLAPIWALPNLQGLSEINGGGAFWFTH
jgi:hypothetical protein